MTPTIKTSELDTFQELVDLIYAASMDVSLWQTLSVRLAGALDATSVAVWAHNDANNGQGYLFKHNLDTETWLPSYLDYYIEQDYFRKAINNLKHGKTYLSHELASDRTLKGNEFYNDFLLSQELAYSATSIVRQQGKDQLSVTAHRNKKAGPFSQEVAKLIDALTPHINRAFSITHHMMQLEMYQGATNDILDRLNVAAAMVDQHGNPILINKKAEALIRQQAGLFIHNGKLCTHNTADTEKLQQLIRKASQYPNSSLEICSSTFTLKREPPRPPLTLLVTPSRAKTETICFEPPRAAAMVFITENSQTVELSADVVGALYGLSPAEAHMAVELANGLSIEQISHKFHLSKNTLRSQLKSVFLKTKTKRQAELVKLILTGPARFAITAK